LAVGNPEWLEEAQHFYIFLEWIRQVKASKTVAKPLTIYKSNARFTPFHLNLPLQLNMTSINSSYNEGEPQNYMFAEMRYASFLSTILPPFH
jgi:hypothetical protein